MLLLLYDGVTILLALTGLVLFSLGVSWSLRPAFERVSTVRMRRLSAVALALLGLAVGRVGAGLGSTAAEWSGLALFSCVALYFVAGPGAKEDVRRAAVARLVFWTGVSALVLACAALSQSGRVKEWTVRRDLARVQTAAAPLVASIESFRAQFGRWPESREELLQFDSSAAAHGLRDRSWRIDGSDVSEHGLVVDIPAILDFDYLVYAPGVELDEDGRAKRFGDWVWYDE